MNNPFSIIGLILCIGLAVGRLVVLWRVFSHATDAARERTVYALEQENERLTRVIATMRRAMKRHGFSVTIDGDLVRIRDSAGRYIQATRIQDGVPEEEL